MAAPARTSGSAPAKPSDNEINRMLVVEVAMALGMPFFSTATIDFVDQNGYAAIVNHLYGICKLESFKAKWLNRMGAEERLEYDEVKRCIDETSIERAFAFLSAYTGVRFDPRENVDRSHHDIWLAYQNYCTAIASKKMQARVVLAEFHRLVKQQSDEPKLFSCLLDAMERKSYFATVVQELQCAPTAGDSASEWYREQHEAVQQTKEGKLFVFRIPKASDGIKNVMGVRIIDMDTGSTIAQFALQNPDNFGSIRVEPGKPYEVQSVSTGGVGTDPFAYDCCFPCCSEPVRFTPTEEAPVGYLLVKGEKYWKQAVAGFGGFFCGAKVTKNMIVTEDRFLQALEKSGKACRRLHRMRGIAGGLRVAKVGLAGAADIINEAANTWETTAMEMEMNLAHFVRTGELEHPDVAESHEQSASAQHHYPQIHPRHVPFPVQPTVEPVTIKAPVRVEKKPQSTSDGLSFIRSQAALEHKTDSKQRCPQVDPTMILTSPSQSETVQRVEQPVKEQGIDAVPDNILSSSPKSISHFPVTKHRARPLPVMKKPHESNSRPDGFTYIRIQRPQDESPEKPKAHLRADPDGEKL